MWTDQSNVEENKWRRTKARGLSPWLSSSRATQLIASQPTAAHTHREAHKRKHIETVLFHCQMPCYTHMYTMYDQDLCSTSVHVVRSNDSTELSSCWHSGRLLPTLKKAYEASPVYLPMYGWRQDKDHKLGI